MPGWMQVVARLNPMTYAIDALRTLILTGWQAGPLLRITAILLAFDGLSLAAASLALRRGLR
jgi:ABC-2 type transport system permease protein